MIFGKFKANSLTGIMGAFKIVAQIAFYFRTNPLFNLRNILLLWRRAGGDEVWKFDSGERLAANWHG